MYGCRHGSSGTSFGRYGPCHCGRLLGATRSACKPSSVDGKTPVPSLEEPSAVVKLLICACAAVIRALSVCLNMLGATSAANRAMIITTTSISMSVTPDLVFLLRAFISHRHFVYARDGEQHAQNQRTHHNTHH